MTPARRVIEVYEETIPDLRGDLKGIIGELYSDGEVQFKINTVGTGVRGTDLFARMMAAFGDRVRSIRAFWPSGTNKDTVNDLIGRGVPLEEAVTRTWTARRAAGAGLKTATVVRAIPDGLGFSSVEVLFEP